MPSTVDGLLVQWGDRLFYPSNRMKASRTPALMGLAVQQQRAQALRQRIRATVERRAPQIMVKVTGVGRGMGAIAAHLRYIAKAGRLPIEDDRGAVREGRDGKRLNPRKEDLHRWRETFAERLRGWRIEAEAWWQAARGVSRRGAAFAAGSDRARCRCANQQQAR